MKKTPSKRPGKDRGTGGRRPSARPPSRDLALDEKKAAFEQVLGQAMQRHSAGQLAEAEALYRRCLAFVPEHPVVLHYLGIVFHQTGRDGEAVETIARALALNPGYAEARYNFANILKARGRVSQAVDEYKTAIASKPDYVEAHYNLGVALQNMKRHDEAILAFEGALRLKPDFVLAYNNLGNALKASGRLEDAVTVFDKAVSLKGDYSEAFNNRGNALMALQRAKEAYRSYCAATEINPKYAEAHSNQGMALRALGRLEEAINCFRKALSIDPGVAEAHVNLAESLRVQGNFGEALQAVHAGLEAFPGHERVYLDVLVAILNQYVPSSSQSTLIGRYVAAQRDLQRIDMSVGPGEAISDTAVVKIYKECQAALTAAAVTVETGKTQVWRGDVKDWGCHRHKAIFEEHTIIPEHCFGCFKVSISVDNVLDLSKLLVVLGSLKLPRNNARKCMVEGRAGIGGTYKGFVYSDDKGDIAVVADMLNRELAMKMPGSATVEIKRGCSEFAQVYPDYKRADDHESPLMAYDQTWRAIEKDFDEDGNFPYRPVVRSYSHEGLTLNDAAIWKNWLRYAAGIGDESYLTLSGGRLEPLLFASLSALPDGDQ